MKPIRLEIAALGPYVGPLVLDFRVLGDNRLFLLNGPTGSGKTMLLDAMCFALFGETTGKQRNAKSLRSQHAPANLLTEVTFDFALGNRQYRVLRRPEQERPRQRGTGTTTEQTKATLWDRTGAADDSVDGEVMAARPAEVNETVVEILGFTADQFRNVTVLPQGEFQRFLNAPSGDREQILEVLFQTSVYRQMQEALLAREQETARAVETGRQSLASLFREALVSSEPELQARIAEIEGQLLNAAEQLETLRVRRGAADAALNAARDADRRLHELRDSGHAFDALAARDAEFRAKQTELDTARRAAPIEPVASERAQRAAELANAEADLVKARVALDLAEKQAARTQQELTAEETREPERNEAFRRQQWLKDLAAKVEQLTTARGLLQSAQGTQQKAEQELDRTRNGLGACNEAIVRGEKAYEDLARIAAPVERYRASVQDLTRIGERRSLLARARSLYSIREQAAHLEADRLATSERVCQEARSALEALDARWMEAQAAVLADSLVPGSPCPVCGSTEHPSPAFSFETLPSETDRRCAREVALSAESVRDGARKAATGAEIELARTAAELQNLTVDLDRWGEIDDADFARRYEGARAYLTAAEDAARKAAEQKQKLDETRGWVPGWQRARDAAEAACRDAASQLEAARAIERERAGAIPSEFQDATALERAVITASERLADLRAKLSKVREAAAEADRQLSARRTHVEQSEKLAVERGGAAASSAERFINALREAGFGSEAEFRPALRTQPQMAELDTAIRQFQNARKAAEERLRRARNAAEGVATPDLAGAESALKLCNQNLEDGILKQDRLKRDSLQNARWLDETHKLAGVIEDADRKLRVISMLAQTANGRNGRRITLQRFVQVTLLERVLAAATQRLQLMSSGRYWLRVAQEGSDRRSTAGLDLEVFDAHTGQARRVSTLSGGESFLASLALALGLSDTVQSHIGGYHLESVFIDEGFGTLDPDALELAMATLRDLQQRGRLVGIISHVPELRHQIDVRLDVTPLKRGSTARFVVAGAGSLGEPLATAD
jgi:exonuclease SbcC